MAVSLALAGCGSDDDGGDVGASTPPVASSAPAATTTTSAPAAPAGGSCAKPTKAVTPATGAPASGPATGDPIKIGALGSYSGAQGDSIGAMDDTIKAWAEYTNANGGINGHPVQITVVDDKGDTGTAVTAAEQMVKDGIVAFVGTGSTIDDAWKGVATKANIPVVGSANYNPSFLAEPCFFASGAQVPQLVYGALAGAKAAGVTKLGIFYCSGDAETPCSNFSKLFQGISGVTVKIPVAIAQSIPDNNPTAALCLAAKAKGVDGIIVIENAALLAKFADVCAQQGYKPKQINVSGTNGKGVLNSKATEGGIWSTSEAPRSDTANPEIAKMIEALNKYAPSVVPGDQYNELGRHVETHPIAGTRPRGKTDDEDVRLAEELKRNEKERAEHVMLVDLGRNDLGRVCEYGSVKVPQYMALERYSHVMHLVSTVDGKLAEGRDHLDALVACFPAGTVSGAPKIRAMQILSGLEPTRRDLYAGAVGYIDFAGNLDFCIAIRTITIRGGRARVQAGAGIVADSNPAAEYEETRDKALALLTALAMAEAGL